MASVSSSHAVTNPFFTLVCSNTLAPPNDSSLSLVYSSQTIPENLKGVVLGTFLVTWGGHTAEKNIAFF